MYNKYFFLHIPKSAGTSLFKIFSDALGNENVKLVENINKGTKQVELLDKYKLVGGHFTYPDYLEVISKERYSITFLRNPVDRFLSQYFYYKNTVGESKQQSVINAQKLDLESYIEYYKSKQRYGEIFNRQLWYLAGYQNPSLTDNELLEIAKENLAKIDFVGIYEEFAESIDLMCFDCKWPLVDSIPMVNVTNKKSTYADIDLSILEKIKELNSLDIKLYEYAVSLFKNKRREILQKAVKMNNEIYCLNSSDAANINNMDDLQKCDKSKKIENKVSTTIRGGSDEVKIINTRIYNSINTDNSVTIESGGEAFIEIIFKSNIKSENIVIGFEIEDQFGQIIYATNSLLVNEKISVETNKTYCIMFSLDMNIAEGRYIVNVAAHSDKCHSFKSELENGFHKFLDLNSKECYDYCKRITEFRVEGIKGTIFRGVAKLEPSLVSSKVEIIDNVDKEISERISLKVKEVVKEVDEKSVFFCLVDIMNCTSKIINSTGVNPIHISYHWIDTKDDTVIEFDGERSSIEPSLLPFTHKEYNLKVISPKKEGKYKLRVTLVQEGIVWLNELNSCLAEDVIIDVKK